MLKKLREQDALVSELKTQLSELSGGAKRSLQLEERNITEKETESTSTTTVVNKKRKVEETQQSTTATTTDITTESEQKDLAVCMYGAKCTRKSRDDINSKCVLFQLYIYHKF